MKTIRAVITIILALAVIQPASGQKNDCVVRKGFAVKPGIKISVTGKYGDINLVTTNQDSVIICATITLNHKDADIATKSLSLIKTEITRTSDSISCATLYDRRFFTSYYAAGRKNFSVDYLIKVPAYANLSLSDEFGNIYLDEHSGFVNVRVIHGSVSAKKLSRANVKPMNNLYISSGKADLGNINWLTATFSHCPQISINKAGAMLISSEFSDIKIEEIRSLVIDSKSDTYSIESLENLVSESTLSSIVINNLQKQLKSDLALGALSIENVEKGFTSIDIKSGMASVNILTDPGLSFETDIACIGTMTDINTEDFIGLEKTGNGNIVKIKGITGKKADSPPLIKIKATGGKVLLKN